MMPFESRTTTAKNKANTAVVKGVTNAFPATTAGNMAVGGVLYGAGTAIDALGGSSMAPASAPTYSSGPASGSAIPPPSFAAATAAPAAATGTAEVVGSEAVTGSYLGSGVAKGVLDPKNVPWYKNPLVISSAIQILGPVIGALAARKPPKTAQEKAYEDMLNYYFELGQNWRTIKGIASALGKTNIKATAPTPQDAFDLAGYHGKSFVARRGGSESTSKSKEE